MGKNYVNGKTFLEKRYRFTFKGIFFLMNRKNYMHSKCVYMYICMCVYICIYIYTYICVCICICVNFDLWAMLGTLDIFFISSVIFISEQRLCLLWLSQWSKVINMCKKGINWGINKRCNRFKLVVQFEQYFYRVRHFWCQFRYNWSPSCIYK